MSLHEIVLPETKPETEWVRGRALQKVSPFYEHGLLQRRLGTALGAWADEGMHGRVASEWRFRLAPPGKIIRPLVPDVAYLSFATLGMDAPRDEVRAPLGAPTVAVEIVSDDDRRANVEDKIATYRAAGTPAVVVVDPRRQTVTIHDADDAGNDRRRVLRAGDHVTLDDLPGFSLDVGALFAHMI